MGYSRNDEDFRADHEHDHRKNWLPEDAPLTRLDPAPRSPAFDTAVLVKGLRNIDEGARLIEQFAATYAAGEKLDAGAALDRITAEMPKRLIAAKLIGACEGLCSSGLLGSGEADMRRLIAEALSAFGMDAANREERVS